MHVCHLGPVNYGQIGNIRRTFVGNKIVDYSDVAGASNYIFILDLTHGFNRLRQQQYGMRRETYKFWGFGAFNIRHISR